MAEIAEPCGCSALGICAEHSQGLPVRHVVQPRVRRLPWSACGCDPRLDIHTGASSIVFCALHAAAAAMLAALEEADALVSKAHDQLDKPEHTDAARVTAANDIIWGLHDVLRGGIRNARGEARA